MAIQKTNPSPRPVSPSRAGTATPAEPSTPGAAAPRTSTAGQEQSTFESGARPRSLLGGSSARPGPLPTAARGVTGSEWAAPAKVSVKAEPNLAIPDRSSVTTSLSIPDDVQVDQLSLDLNIAHPYRGDLKVTLTSPSGKSAVVHNGTGAGADNLMGSFDLSAFAGESAKGEWKLTVQDRLGGDVGTLKSWGLNVNQPPVPQKPTSNEFVRKLSGRYPPVAAGGFFAQLKQSAATAQLTLSAASSVSSGGRNPPDFSVASKLRSLSVTPLLNEPDKTTRADYFSQIPGAKPEQVYEYFVNNPSAFFGAAGLKVRPETAKLQNGTRLMLEQAGSPSVWFPIEVRLDPTKRRVDIATLDGHPLRGSNQFTFADDGKGGTSVNQISSFQLSSKAVELGMGADDLEGQHTTWIQGHGHLFEHFYPRS